MTETCKSKWWINSIRFMGYSTSVNYWFHERVKSQLPREYNVYRIFESEEIDLVIDPGQCVSISYDFTDITNEAVGECCSALFFRSCKEERTVFKYTSSFAEIVATELVGCGNNTFFDGRILSRTPIIASEFGGNYRPYANIANSKNFAPTSNRHKPYFLSNLELNKSSNGITAKKVSDITILKAKESDDKTILEYLVSTL
ncbi:hypothetical protein AYI69_g1691 [Smittium culicis]|uniref:Uncharacterized protein n=1 Tax=Smittium culicis TaxID=133412 RepID=A0A1R1YPL7_9FUNG|nr:hypothetical protein AYI69_g6532 [Smittium culicis]OMJ28823.1 hypothetical protein AYI69_g1691 [Smittium culicis]